MDPIIPYTKEAIENMYEDTKEFINDIDIQKLLDHMKDYENRMINELAHTMYYRYNAKTFQKLNKLKHDEIEKIMKTQDFKNYLKVRTALLDKYRFDKYNLAIVIPTGGCMDETIDLFDMFASKEYNEKEEELNKQIKPIRYFEDAIKERRNQIENQ